MKRFIIIFLIFILLFSNTISYAINNDYLPYDVFRKAEEIRKSGLFGNDYIILRNKIDKDEFVIITSDITEPGRKLLVNTDDNTINCLRDFKTSQRISIVKTYDAGLNYQNANVTTNVSINNHDIVYVNVDILSYKKVDFVVTVGDVFFSQKMALPLQWTVVPEMSSFVPNVASKSRVILVSSAVILAIMAGVSLIPKVLYRLF